MSHFVLPQGRRSQKQEFAGKSMGESVIQKHAVFSALPFILKNNKSAQNASHDFRPAWASGRGKMAGAAWGRGVG